MDMTADIERYEGGSHILSFFDIRYNVWKSPVIEATHTISFTMTACSFYACCIQILGCGGCTIKN